MMKDTIQDMRKRCRMAMNGVASASMREKGLSYKVNFGLSIQQIRDLAKSYQPDTELAEQIWKEDTRELKILATLLYPLAEFTEDAANRWVREIPNQEIREQVCFNLFQNLPFANGLVEVWVKDTDENIRATGYWLSGRLLFLKRLNHQDISRFGLIWDDAVSGNVSLRNSATLALKHIGRQSKETADAILKKFSAYQTEEDLIKREIYDRLAFEFEYYFK